MVSKNLFKKEGKEVLTYVVSDGYVSFPQGGSFKIEFLEDIVKQAKKKKLKKNEVMIAIGVRLPHGFGKTKHQKRKTKTKKGASLQKGRKKKN